jgi:hypothetical protein
MNLTSQIAAGQPSATPLFGDLPIPEQNQHNFVDLQELQEKLLAPRALVRDESGYLMHPDLPVLDESVRIDAFLAAFGLDSSFVGMEWDCPNDDRVDAYFDGDIDCSWWEPTAPEGAGWVLLEIYDTENGPYALFVRQKPKVVPLSRRARREAEEAAKEAERVALAKTREGWRVMRVENLGDSESMQQARASWAEFDAAQTLPASGEDLA